MKALAIVVGVLAGAFALLAFALNHGSAVFFAAADYMARRRMTALERNVT